MVVAVVGVVDTGRLSLWDVLDVVLVAAVARVERLVGRGVGGVPLAFFVLGVDWDLGNVIGVREGSRMEVSEGLSSSVPDEGRVEALVLEERGEVE